MFCARHALLDGGGNGHADPTDEARIGNGGGGNTISANGVSKPAATVVVDKANTNGEKDKMSIHDANGGSNGHGCALDSSGNGSGDGGEEEDSSFLLVLGDHLYRRGPGTTHACASQLVHAFLEHGQAGKPAIGLKVRGGGSLRVFFCRG